MVVAAVRRGGRAEDRDRCGILLDKLGITTTEFNRWLDALPPEVPEAIVPDDAEQASPLEVLDWMVGEWVDQGEEATIITR